jgi:hypothetical protein
MQRQAEERNRELARYRSMQEEQRLARFVMERLINREALNDPVVSHFIASAAEFSGDLIAAARTRPTCCTSCWPTAPVTVWRRRSMCCRSRRRSIG